MSLRTGWLLVKIFHGKIFLRPCYFSIILSFLFSGTLHAQMYRVFFVDKGNVQQGADSYESPTPLDYINSVKLQVDSVYMVSNWLNYALIEAKEYPAALLQLPFVKKLEEVEFMQSIPLQLNLPADKVNDKDSADKQALDEHRQWQLDTLGYAYFQEKKITGKGIIIAIIDAGFNHANESKAFTEIFSSNRVLKTYDFIDNDTNVYHGSNHGTAVWSCIAGNIPGRQTGLATGSSFILLRSEDEKTETMADEDRWIQAIEMAYTLGADIVNSSLGFSNVLHKRADLNGQTLISKAADIAAKKGMLVVISAGNEWITLWKTLCVPSDAEGVITVGGIDKDGKHSYFSSVGPTADGRSKPDVVAPGTCAIVKGNDVILGSGTSYSAPLVAGYLACMLELKGGKKNFPKDSLKFYCGLYPYFDYVFGYGVPGIIRNWELPFDFMKALNKSTKTFYPGNTTNGVRNTFYDDVFLKITDSNGVIKFSKKFKRLKGGSFKIPTAKSKPNFSYSKYYDPHDLDVWSIWWNGHYSDY